ncbi:MAG: TIGR00269 family protein [Candidatus Diapherotrites archaeon]|nr:TIGR00269 family protein [Candidatus Diapherotrites archaeon]
MAKKEKEPAGQKKCDRCGAKAAITLAYGPHHFCEKHFTDFFEKRFRKTARKYGLIRNGEKILVALSGGKDSTLLLHLLKKFYSRNHKIEALIIDEGISGYRDEAIKIAVKNCKKLGVKPKIVSFKKEFGVTNDKIMPLIFKNSKLGGTCAFCGTMRRNLMNRGAKRLGADKLATGHNLDDEAQSILMNIFNNDFERFRRTGATAGVMEHNGFVKRIKPFYETPEDEILAYCSFRGIEHFSGDCCPYSWTAKRNEYRKIIDDLEKKFPNTKFSLLRFYENLKPLLAQKKGEKKAAKKALGKCEKCGEPTEHELCMACKQVKKIIDLI